MKTIYRMGLGMGCAWLVTGCVTSSIRSLPYTPGTVPEVAAVRASMTEAQAVSHIRRVVTEALKAEYDFGEPATDKIWCRAEVKEFDKNGYTFVEKGAFLVKESFTMVGAQAWDFSNRHMQDMGKTFAYTNAVRFADVTHATLLQGQTAGKPSHLQYGNGNSILFGLNVEDAPDLQYRTMAAMEMLCPNLAAAAPGQR